MAVEWTDYGDLLNELSSGTTWSEQDSYGEFRAYLDGNYPELGPDGEKVSKGYESLLDGLLDDMSGNEEMVYRKFRIIALAYPDPDEGYAGWVRSADFADRPVRVPVEQLYTAGPDSWTPVELEGEASGQKVPDTDTGLMFDAQHWYTPDGKTIVYLDPNDRNWSYDDDGNWYERGILSAGTAEEAAVAVSSGPIEGLTLDAEANLYYDDKSWYLNDRTTVVYLSPDHPGFAYDDDGNWYEHGERWTPAGASAAAPAETPAPETPVDDELILEKGAEVLSDLKALASENGLQLSDEMVRELQDDPAFKEEVMKIAKQLLTGG